MVPLFLFNEYKKNTNNFLFHLLREWYFCGSFNMELFFCTECGLLSVA